ncbi:MAG: hypothetical protein LQ346_003604 [Caloplaca aetnensis]|nr:MAG: hypothetical protein LQ346_003604 [Caloplaca aetnensis]
MEEAKRNGRRSTAIKHDGLGKLSCLGAEVRRMIYQEVIQSFEEDFFTKHLKAYRMQCSQKPNAKPQYPYSKDTIALYDAFFKKWGFWYADDDTDVNNSEHSVAALRRTSRAIKRECDETFLSTRVMEFGCFVRADILSTWLFRPSKTAMIRRISINLCSCCTSRSQISTSHGRPARWSSFLASNPFPNLQTAVLDLDHEHGQGFYLDALDSLPRDCEGDGSCTVGLRSIVQLGVEQKCRHIRQLHIRARQPARDLTELGKVVRILALSVPNATIRLAQANEDCRICHEKCRAIIKKIVERKARGYIPKVPKQHAVLKWSDLERSESILEIDRRRGNDSAANQARLRQMHFRYFAA